MEVSNSYHNNNSATTATTETSTNKDNIEYNVELLVCGNQGVGT